MPVDPCAGHPCDHCDVCEGRTPDGVPRCCGPACGAPVDALLQEVLRQQIQLSMYHRRYFEEWLEVRGLRRGNAFSSPETSIKR